MTFKKLLSVLLVAVMVLSLGMTAFATESAESGQEIVEGEPGWEFEVGTSTYVPAIKVQVPQAVGFIVNPYRLDAKNEELGITTTGDTQIVAPTQKIVNLSEFDLSIAGTVSGEAPEGAKLLTSNASWTTGSDNKVPKEAKIVYGALVEENVAIPATGTYTPKTVDKDTVAAAAATTPVTGVAVDVVPANNDVASPIPALTVKKKPATDASGDDLKNTYWFTFYGEVQDKPSEPWTEDDVFGAFLTFTFTAKANEAPADDPEPTTYTIGAGTVTDADSDISATVYKVDGTAVTSAEESDTVTIEITATSGKTITASIDGGTTTINMAETSGTYTGTFTMPASNVTVDITVA